VSGVIDMGVFRGFPLFGGVVSEVMGMGDFRGLPSFLSGGVVSVVIEIGGFRDLPPLIFVGVVGVRSERKRACVCAQFEGPTAGTWWIRIVFWISLGAS